MPITITPGYLWKTADVVTPARLNRAIAEQQLAAAPLTLLGVPAQPVANPGDPQPESAPVTEIPVTPDGMALLSSNNSDTNAMFGLYAPLLNAIYPVGVTYTTLGDNDIPAFVKNLGAWEKKGAIPAKTSGATAERPVNPPEGYEYYDTTINVPLIFAGGAWITKDGQPGDVKDVTDTGINAALAKNPGWQQHADSVGKVIAGATADASDAAHAPGATAGKESDTVPAGALKNHAHFTLSAVVGSANDRSPSGTKIYVAKSNDDSGFGAAYSTFVADKPTWGVSGGVINPDGTTANPDDKLSLMQPTLYLFKLVKSALGAPSATPSNASIATLWQRTS